MAKKKGLGKGLDALFVDNNTEDGAIVTLRITEIEPNKLQPRKIFEDEALCDLADSIRLHGIIQPLVVRPLESGVYQIVAGERRWRAARMAGLLEVPVIIRDFDDMQTLEVAIIENLQREDLNPMELAQGYQALIEGHGMTQDEVAAKVGKSRPVVANTIRLLGLPERVQDYIAKGAISMGHAKAILALEDPAQMEAVAEQVVNGHVLVRDIEKLARQKKTTDKVAKEPQPVSDAIWGDNFYKEMELALSAELGRKIKIVNYGKRSTIEVEFYNNEELADIAARLTKSNY